MQYLHPAFAQALAIAAFAPPVSLNDDDLYVVDLKTVQPVTSYG